MVKTFTVINRRLDAMAGDIEEVKGHQVAMTNDMGMIRRRQDVMANDIGQVKGGHALAEVAKDAAVIAFDMGPTYVSEVSKLELAQMAQKIIDKGFEPNEVGSFRKADLVVKAENESGQVYLAVEVSFTADVRDTGRARRNAGFLREITKCPAHAVIASVRNDRYVQGLIDKGEVHWHRIDQRGLEPE